jgi:hypothetical protein
MGAPDRPLTDVTAARRTVDPKRTKAAAPMMPRRPLMIVPVMLPERRESITAALTP